MSEQDSLFNKHNKKTMAIIKISAVATFVATLICVFFVMPEEYINYSIPLIIGEIIRNILLVSILVEIIYFLVNKTELSPIYKKINEEAARCTCHQKETHEIKNYDSLDPGYGVNNPASPFCHNLSRLNDHRRRDY